MVAYARLTRTMSASPTAVVATPTTMAVRMSTWGSGFEYRVHPSARIGAVPPDTFPTEMKKRNTEVWKMLRPMIFLTRFPLAATV